jgi:hypothetical protein
MSNPFIPTPQIRVYIDLIWQLAAIKLEKEFSTAIYEAVEDNVNTSSTLMPDVWQRYSDALAGMKHRDRMTFFFAEVERLLTLNSIADQDLFWLCKDKTWVTHYKEGLITRSEFIHGVYDGR